VPDLRASLAEHLAKAGVAPFLFVGAGLSRRYLQLDDWEALLQRMANLTARDYDYYRATAGGEYPAIATEIAKELHPLWWKDAEFRAARERFKGRLGHPDSALKAETSLYLEGSISQLPSEGGLAEELELLSKAVIDGVVTTNFDPLLEHVFPEFKVFVGQEQLLFGDALGVGEIYKIHGSHEEPDSLVLTAADYERFDQRNAYLAAKLMTIFVEHPIVFLGYRIGDRNVSAILNSIVGCLDSKESIEKLADRLIFIEWDPEVIEPQLASGTMKVGDTPVPMKVAAVPDFRDVYAALGELQRGFSAKLLRQLKEQVYELVLEDNPKGRLHVAELGSDDDLSEVEVVFGVGAISALRTYTGLTRDEVVEDVINEETGLIPNRVVQEALPAILSHPGNVPIYKYLREAGLLDKEGSLLAEADIDKKVAAHIRTRAKRLGLLNTYRRGGQKAAREQQTLGALIDAFDPHLVLQYIPALPEEEIDPEELRRFLIKTEDLYEQEPHRSQWIKMACLYDWLRYGRQNKSKARRGRRPRLKAASKSA
jgi:SIR2-like domain